MCRYGHSSILGNVPCCLLSPVLDDEAAEATDINRFSLGNSLLDALCELVHNCLNLDFFNSGLFCDLIDDLCFFLIIIINIYKFL